MRIAKASLLMVMAFSMTALAAKIQGTTTLRDLQPTGNTGKNHKHQQFDLFFDGAGMQYTCRTSEKKTLKATDFVVGSYVGYEINGNKGKLRNTQGQQIDCQIVRVESVDAPRQ